MARLPRDVDTHLYLCTVPFCVFFIRGGGGEDITYQQRENSKKAEVLELTIN